MKHGAGHRVKRMLEKERAAGASEFGQAKSRAVLRSVGHELKANPPRVLAKTRRKKGKKAAESQRVAILLSKARRRGAGIPKK